MMFIRQVVGGRFVNCFFDITPEGLQLHVVDTSKKVSIVGALFKRDLSQPVSITGCEFVSTDTKALPEF
jgi:hypothetical protein